MERRRTVVSLSTGEQPAFGLSNEAPECKTTEVELALRVAQPDHHGYRAVLRQYSRELDEHRGLACTDAPNEDVWAPPLPVAQIVHDDVAQLVTTHDITVHRAHGWRDCCRVILGFALVRSANALQPAEKKDRRPKRERQQRHHDAAHHAAREPRLLAAGVGVDGKTSRIGAEDNRARLGDPEDPQQRTKVDQHPERKAAPTSGPPPCRVNTLARPASVANPSSNKRNRTRQLTQQATRPQDERPGRRLRFPHQTSLSRRHEPYLRTRHRIARAARIALKS